MKLKTICLLSFLSLFYACGPKTNDAPQNQCTSVTNIKANASVTVIENGKPFNFTADSAKELSCTWQIPGLSASSKFTNTIPAVSFTNEGWYKVEVRNTCGEIKKDSFYLDVTMPQGTLPCTIADNSITYTPANHENITFTKVQVDTTYGYGFLCEGVGTTTLGSSVTFRFNPIYRSQKKAPDAGVYTTRTYATGTGWAFGENDLDKVYIDIIAYGGTNYYRALSNQNVYVSYINGKMKVSFCNLSFTGSSNTTINSTLSATEK